MIPEKNMGKYSQKSGKGKPERRNLDLLTFFCMGLYSGAEKDYTCACNEKPQKEDLCYEYRKQMGIK